ncbi:thioredoxin domain-containing protein [Candidatus Uabimicrobium amorphum]|uniref:Thioredoxin domain-containing protein n=1 Tax=Uabimicrobium amorphum TaxID=2596890 RepID=A0A5S9F2Y0_UABAM|nr:DUF255 domain-containing protein [Candidatus Uabimicrobium amorphum]BBM82834.1 thioredoxin domain-containing protein [Candidatus Uabimicrobium amorphum]
MFRYAFVLVIFLSGCYTSQNMHNNSQPSILWETWSNDVFAKAQQENRLVILDLKSNWCHWCHVMEQTTYEDSDVVKMIDAHYIPVRVDQDSHPALANRYRQYGWPATIIFTADGREILKNRGYIPPQRMSKLLQELFLNPQAQEGKEQVQYAKEHTLSVTTREVLKNKYRKTYDAKFGGLKLAKKFLDWDSVEYALVRAQLKDDFSDKVARSTLDGAAELIDPVWGGMYQYSTHGDWQHAHYEKIMATQVRAIKAYASGYRVYREPKYLRAAKKICDYMQEFLMSSDGVFYTSQDADVVPGQKSDAYFALGDEKRREQGIPRVDKSVYSRENGWAIEAFALMYAVTDDEKYLQIAQNAGEWFLKNRRSGLGFTHGAKDNGGPYLSGNIALAAAFIQLYEVTATEKWLQSAKQTLDFIAQNLRNERGGYYGEAPAANSVISPINDLSENIAVTRCANKVYHYTNKDNYLQMARHAMQYLATESILKKRLTEPAILLADEELAAPPLHVTVVGVDEEAKALFMRAQKFMRYHKVIEWLQEKEDATNNAGITFPSLPFSAAFLCADGACSAPIREADELEGLLLEQALIGE